MQKDTRRLINGLQKCNTTAKNLPETGTKTRQPAYCSLCPPPPWRGMHPLCPEKDMICTVVSEKWHISTGSCQFQGKLNEVKSQPAFTDRKRKAISRGKGRGSCMVLVLLRRLFFTENVTLVSAATILALHESNRLNTEAEKVADFWRTPSGWIQCSKLNPTAWRKKTHRIGFCFVYQYSRSSNT